MYEKFIYDIRQLCSSSNINVGVWSRHKGNYVLLKKTFLVLRTEVSSV